MAQPTRAQHLHLGAEPSTPVEWPTTPTTCPVCHGPATREIRDLPAAEKRQTITRCDRKCSPAHVTSEAIVARTFETDGGRVRLTLNDVRPTPAHLLPVEARKPLRGTVPPQATCARGDHPEAVDEFAEVVRLLQRMTPATQDAAVAAARAITADRRRRSV